MRVDLNKASLKNGIFNKMAEPEMTPARRWLLGIVVDWDVRRGKYKDKIAALNEAVAQAPPDATLDQIACAIADFFGHNGWKSLRTIMRDRKACRRVRMAAVKWQCDIDEEEEATQNSTL